MTRIFKSALPENPLIPDGAVRPPSALLLFVILADAALMALIFTTLPPVLPAIAEHFGGGERGRFAAQMIITMPSVGLMFGGSINGWLVDRFNARSVLLAGLAVFALSGSAGLYLENLWLLGASRLVLGFCSTSITTGSAWLLATWVAPAVRPQLLGYRNAFGGLAGVLSTFIAGPAAEAMGWRIPFSFYFVSLAVLAVALVAVPRTAQIKSVKNTQAMGSLSSLWPIYAITIAIFVAVYATFTQLSFLLADEGISSPSTQAWVIGVGSLASLISSVFYGFIRRHLGVHGSLVLILTTMAAGALTIGFSRTPELAALGSALNGFGGGIATPYLCNLVFDRTSESVRGRAIGFLYSMMFLGDFLNPILFQPIRLWLGMHGAFLTMGCLLGSAALVAAVNRSVQAKAIA